MSTISSTGIGQTHATFVLETETRTISLSFDRDGAMSVNSCSTGITRSTPATAGSLAKRLNLRARAVNLFRDFDTEQAKKAVRTSGKGAADSGDGFDSPLATSTGVPNVVGWTDLGSCLAYGNYRIGSLPLGGYGWSDGDGALHLAKDKKPFGRTIDAVFAIQLTVKYARVAAA